VARSGSAAAPLSSRPLLPLLLVSAVGRERWVTAGGVIGACLDVPAALISFPSAKSAEAKKKSLSKII
jgi:hypothetical protein